MKHRSPPAAQRGVVLPLVGLTIVVMIGFAGLVVDLGGMFVAKTELQSALDSCSLAAAKELDGSADALTRATNAGRFAGNRNKVGYQSTAAGIATTDVTFSDTLGGSYSAAFSPVANARYVRCQHATTGLRNYLIQVAGGPSTSTVGALAIATLAPAQTTCPLPVGVKARTLTPPNYGYLPGEWVTMLFDPTKTPPQDVGWLNLDGSTSASETKAEVAGNGFCGSKIGDVLRTPGAKVSVTDEWNARFGIYKNAGDPTASTMKPDLTGYVYTATNWKPVAPATVPRNAYAGAKPAGSHASAANFQTKRTSYASYADTSSAIATGDTITGFKMRTGGGYKALATPGTGGEHQTLGQNRRVVLSPVVSASGSGYAIIDYACMLMLQPIDTPASTVQLEFIGNASTPGTPCSVAGLPGGATGPRVPALVR